jgi:hypothetical protein
MSLRIDEDRDLTASDTDTEDAEGFRKIAGEQFVRRPPMA